ncbi:MAG: TRAP transporter large permease subunit, partial [Myxococcota bacterium]
MASSLILLTLGLLLSLGFAAGHSAEKLGLPRVAIYVLVGVVFSESLLGGLLPGDPRAWDPVLVDASLGGIAFLIGGEVRPSRLKTLGRTFAGGLAGQTLGALLLVTGALWGWQTLVSPPPDASVALVLAAIATATAPAATLAVIEQYRCSGPLTATLLYIVAVDDALAIVLFSLAVALARRQLTWREFRRALLETIRTSCMVMVIVSGAVIFGHFLAVTRIPSELASWLSQLPLPSWVVMGFIILFYLLAGCFVDALALVLLTVPIFHPVVLELGYDPIWFGVIIVVVTQMGVISPPVGVNV